MRRRQRCSRPQPAPQAVPASPSPAPTEPPPSTSPAPSESPDPPSHIPYGPIHTIPGLVPPDYTFLDYLELPTVNGHFMAIFARTEDHVRLPCRVLDVDEENERALVQAADGAIITVVNIKVKIRNLYIEVEGKPVGPDVLEAIQIVLLRDNEDLEIANRRMEVLMDPSTWGVDIS